MPQQLGSTYEIAKLFEVTPRYVRKLRQAGVLENALTPSGEVIPGKFELGPTIRRYCRYLTNLTRTEGVEIDLAAAKLVKARALAETETLRLKTLQSELHPAADVAVLMNYVLESLARRARALPDELAPKLVGETQISKIMNIVTAGINRVLQSSTSIDAAKFAQDNIVWLTSEGLTAEEIEAEPQTKDHDQPS